jgi:O-acetyl-ADP-ribose deacetylase (regulator of RNase III)
MPMRRRTREQDRAPHRRRTRAQRRPRRRTQQAAALLVVPSCLPPIPLDSGEFACRSDHVVVEVERRALNLLVSHGRITGGAVPLRTGPFGQLALRIVAVREDVSMIELEVLQADVTKLEVDAITNAANTRLKHGGGVAAAIARAGGPEVQRESNEKAPIGLGEAVETTAGAMPARYVIHAATMELGGPTSAEIIARATRSTLRRADELGCRSLALVAFGTGVGGFPLDEAAQLMVGAVRQHQPRTLQRVVFAVHGDAAERAFRAAVEG